MTAMGTGIRIRTACSPPWTRTEIACGYDAPATASVTTAAGSNPAGTWNCPSWTATRVTRSSRKERTSLLRVDAPGEVALFGSAAGLVRSQALLRLAFGRGAPVGLLCIGTRQPGRFHPGLGTELLSFLARVLGVTIAQWLNPPR